jgi:hypothetical protein
MAVVTPIQNSFAAGELSPRMLSRTDLKGYKEGCLIAHNMIPVSQGPALSRPGTAHVTTLKGIDSARLIPFPVRPDEGYILTFYEDNLLILNESALPTAENLVTNPRFQQSGFGWTSYVGVAGGPKGTVNFNVGTCTLDAATNNPAAIRQEVTGLTIGAQYRVGVQTINYNNARIKLGTSAGGSQLANQSMGTKAVQVITVTATTTSIWIEVGQDAGATGVCIIASCGMIDVAAPLTQVVLTSPYKRSNLRDIQAEMRPAGGVMYFTHPLVPPQKLVRDPALGTFSLEAVTFTAEPEEWDVDNYPAALTFYDGRLWYAGVNTSPSKVWASKSGLYEDFTIGANADDALAYTIAKAGFIRWLKGVKSLLVGTDNSEFVISSEGGVITPSDIVIEPQSAYGSLAATPLAIGNQVIYTGADGRKLRAMGYRFEESGWVSTDLSFASEHITAGRIYEFAWSQNPENLIWGVDLLGRLIGCTYDKANNLIGWHQHAIGDVNEDQTRQCISVCALRFLGTDTAWLAVRWQDGDVISTSIMAMMRIDEESFYMDDASRQVFETPVNSVSGLTWLEGQTVSITVDGAVHPERVVTGGTVELQFSGKEIVVGLGYHRKLKPMPFEPGQSPNGTEPYKKRFNKIYASLLVSMRPIINGVRPSTRYHTDPMNTRGTARSEDVQVLGLGYSRRETVTIEEVLPVPLTVLSIYGEMGIEQ